MDFRDMTLVIPNRLTESASTYLQVHFELVSYFNFTESITAEVDMFIAALLPIVIREAEKIRDKQETTNPLLEEMDSLWQEVKDEPSRMKKKMAKYDPLLTSAIFTKAVDNFLNYLADILSEAFRVKPEALKSNDIKRVDWILSFSDFNDLVAAIAEDKVLTLSHSNIKDLDKFMREKMAYLSWNCRRCSKGYRLLMNIETYLCITGG